MTFIQTVVLECDHPSCLSSVDTGQPKIQMGRNWAKVHYGWQSAYVKGKKKDFCPQHKLVR